MQAILKVHNDLRSKYGNPALTWSNSQEQIAQDWSNRCYWGHSTDTAVQQALGLSAPASPYGENIASGGGNDSPADLASGWAAEESRYDWSNPTDASSAGHFVAIVWKGVTQVGCGWTTCNGTEKFLVCQYIPPGGCCGAADFLANIPYLGVGPAPPSQSGAAFGGGSLPGGDNLSSGDISTLLNIHNTVRAKYGTPPLKWSTDLQGGAQTWINDCSNLAQPSNNNGAYGENIALLWDPTTLTDLAQKWVDQAQYYDWSKPGVVEGDDPSKDSMMFTQMVWRDTTQVGCGVNACNGLRELICRYLPGWNKPGAQAFINNVPQLSEGGTALSTATTVSDSSDGRDIIASTTGATPTPTGDGSASSDDSGGSSDDSLDNTPRLEDDSGAVAWNPNS